jgi:hypothetical protein
MAATDAFGCAAHKTRSARRALADIAANNNTAHLATPEIAALCVNTHSMVAGLCQLCAHKSRAKADTALLEPNNETGAEESVERLILRFVRLAPK